MKVQNYQKLFLFILGVVLGVLTLKMILFLDLHFTTLDRIGKLLFDNNCELIIKPQNAVFKKHRILCWVMTAAKYHQTRAQFVKDTWGRRCDKLIFMSGQNDSSLPAFGLPVDENYDKLWGKTKAAFKFVYDNYFNDYDWFLKADDDAYVVMENLRLMLFKEDIREPKYFGYVYRLFVKQGYMSGTAYVLSKEALQRLIEDALPDPSICRSNAAGAEDVEIGLCLERVGVKAIDCRDIYGRERIIPQELSFHLISKPLTPQHWYWNSMYYPNSLGSNCCSDLAIAFNYIEGAQQLVFDYFLYIMKPYGISYN